MNKFIVWGCKDIDHSHTFIHYAYKKAFQSLGWETYWLDDRDDVSNFDFSNTLFLTLGGFEDKIPKRKDCKYILHNCEVSKYEGLDWLVLQVYTHDVLPREVEKLTDCIYYQSNARTLYQPWATDLLPSEILDLESLNFNQDKKVYWIGSVWDSAGQGNINEINQLKAALIQREIEFINPTKIPYHLNKDYIDLSYISPAIQGKWQVDNGYIPCRIFKNISYGSFGITNSPTVYNLFNQTILFEDNIEEMVERALVMRNNISLTEINNQIAFVRDKHTYLDRINNILKLI